MEIRGVWSKRGVFLVLSSLVADCEVVYWLEV